MIDVISLKIEGKEFQSLAPAYLNVDCPTELLTFERSNNVLSHKSLSCILHLNLKISLNWSGQSKLCNILKILINRKKRLLLLMTTALTHYAFLVCIFAFLGVELFS